MFSYRLAIPGIAWGQLNIPRSFNIKQIPFQTMDNQAMDDPQLIRRSNYELHFPANVDDTSGKLSSDQCPWRSVYDDPAFVDDTPGYWLLDAANQIWNGSMMSPKPTTKRLRHNIAKNHHRQSRICPMGKRSQRWFMCNVLATSYP